MPDPLVYICILNWNGYRDTIECLESVYRNSYPNYRVTVIDNASTDGSLDEIRAWAGGVRQKGILTVTYDIQDAERGGVGKLEENLAAHPMESLVLIRSDDNLGFSGGNNIGIHYALSRGTDYIWLLNNDTIIHEDALAEMVMLAEQDPKVGMVGSKLLYYRSPGKIQVLGGGKGIPLYLMGITPGSEDEDKGQWDSVFEIDYIFGASLLVRAETVQSTRLLSEDYFLLFEDIDWCLRAKRKGWKLLYCPGSIVLHKISRSIVWTSPFSDYYYVRNMLFFVRKFYLYLLPLAYIRIFFRMLKRMSGKKLDNVKAMIKGMQDFSNHRMGQQAL